MVHRYLGTASVVLVSIAGCAEIANVRDDLVFLPDGGGPGPGGDGAIAIDAANDSTAPDGPTSTSDAAVCGEGETVCDDQCVNTQTDPLHCGTCRNACKSPQVCDRGQCKGGCTGTLVNCSGACVDTQTDESHCGACDQPCTSTQTCTSGSCEENPKDAGRRG